MKTNDIKFFWNGVKVNGGKLIRCFYLRSPDSDSITICARDYSDLPGDIFTVENDTDLYTDYFDTDSATVTPAHPLYKYIAYAATRAQAHDIKTHLKYIQNRRCYNAEYKAAKAAELAELEAIKNPGQPTAADLALIEQANIEAENARKAAEQAAEQAEREKVLNAKCNGRRFIEATAAEHPITDGDPVVTIQWSEHPAFYSWKDNELKLSVAAAEIVLKHYDEERHQQNTENGGGGYDKTSFLITFTDENGEPNSYEGRYDLGDNDGGMIAHIRAFGEYRKDTAVIELANWLETFTASHIVSVDFAPWVKQAIEARKQQAAKEARETLEMVDMLTNEQLEAAIMASTDKDVARFFLQALAVRDKSKAVEVFKRWKENA